MSGFLTPLVMRPNKLGRTWTLEAPLVYHSALLGRIVVEAGFECDLNSIPQPFWVISPPSDYPKAGVLHDWLYRTHPNRKEADEVYREALEVLGMDSFRRNLRYYALRLFGGSAFQKENEHV